MICSYLRTFANNTRKRVECKGKETHEQHSRLNPHLLASGEMQSQLNLEIQAWLYM